MQFIFFHLCIFGGLFISIFFIDRRQETHDEDLHTFSIFLIAVQYWV